MNRGCIKCQKDKFYDNVDEIFRVMKNKCDFIVNKGRNNNDIFELNVINKEKLDIINDITPEINKIVS